MDGRNFAAAQWFIQKVLVILLAVAVFAAFFINGVLLNADFFTRPERRRNIPEKAGYDIKFIDLSAWNEVTDWDMIKASGVEGVVLRLARYNLGKDPVFDEYYREAKARGLYVGCYYFMNAQSTEDALADAEHVLELIREGGYEFELPVFYDVEDDGTNGNTVSHLGRKELTSIIKTFCEKMTEEGIYTGYYSNLNFASSYYDSTQLTKYPFWLAAYSRDISGDEYSNLVMWQMTDEGSVPGVDGNCDINKCFVQFEGFMDKWRVQK